MTTLDARELAAGVTSRWHDEYAACSEALVRDFPELPAGSVLRCFARALLVSRRAGCPLHDLPAEAARRARILLRGRVQLTDAR